ncbi:hypothetical protein EJ06DRAFT_546027 [Trichodelitschia bisporula]|uniref:Uncharacterized protein n=1 Tax=Trichodelitschia bisporula TaxID=703511 RepID=A0A6G1IBB2_9PEZI|nr:hypothetical protein EJ06DRAFT_546027 [Trichodelitschia bisporula]
MYHPAHHQQTLRNRFIRPHLSPLAFFLTSHFARPRTIPSRSPSGLILATMAPKPFMHDPTSTLRLLTAIIELTIPNPGSVPWDEVASRMGPEFSVTAVRHVSLSPAPNHWGHTRRNHGIRRPATAAATAGTGSEPSTPRKRHRGQRFPPVFARPGKAGQFEEEDTSDEEEVEVKKEKGTGGKRGAEREERARNREERERSEGERSVEAEVKLEKGMSGMELVPFLGTKEVIVIPDEELEEGRWLKRRKKSIKSDGFIKREPGVPGWGHEGEEA